MRNWEDVVPKKLAMHQEAWERRRRVMHARNNGATLQQIAKNLKMTKERIRQMDLQARRRYEDKSPIEQYFEHFPWEKCPGNFGAIMFQQKYGLEKTYSEKRNLRHFASQFINRIGGAL